MSISSKNTSKSVSGPRYWRSLDHLAETPQFQQWMEKEFPSGAEMVNDPVSRRGFMKVMSASFALAGLGLTGCRRPEHKILPFSRMPENYVHGEPQYFASAMPTRRSAVPVVVKSMDGRPIKIEGNGSIPGSNGGTDHFTQASILSLYDPDRALNFKSAGKVAARDEVLKGMVEGLDLSSLHVLMEQSSSPSRARLVKDITSKGARCYEYEAVDFSAGQEAATELFGRPLKPLYRFENATRILSLDCDFLGGEEDAHANVQGFAEGRRIRDDKQQDPCKGMNRLYSVEGLLTLTGSNADHRLRVATGAVQRVAIALFVEFFRIKGPGSGLEGEDANQFIDDISNLAGDLKKDFDVDPTWIRKCAEDLAEAGSKALVVAGYRQPKEVHMLALAFNYLSCQFNPSDESPIVLIPAGDSGAGTLEALFQKGNFKEGDHLAILGGNPAYNAPGWQEVQEKAGRVIRLGYAEDETSAGKCNFFLPQAHYLESWGDARTADGTLVSVQPLIAPLFDGVTELEVLTRLAGAAETDPYIITRATFESIAGKGEDGWERFLHHGFLEESKAVPVRVDVQGAPERLAAAFESYDLPGAPSGNGKLEVVFYRDHSIDDGRHNNNAWLQETPDPITRIAWGNVLLVSKKTAERLAEEVKLDFQDKRGGLAKRFGVQPEVGRFQQKNFSLQVGNDKVKVTGPIWIQPGMADDTVAVALGYGRKYETKKGRVGMGSGFNAYTVRPASSGWIAGGVTLKSDSGVSEVCCTQEQGVMDGRPVIREATVESFKNARNFVNKMDLDGTGHTKHIPMESDEEKASWEKHERRPKTIYDNNLFTPRNGPTPMDPTRQQWGMVIDLGTCVGCNACVVACQSENNIPVVGKEQLAKGREMSWIRVDRYYSGEPSDPQVNFQALNCQHCEDAPCESVCPVNATVHDEEGLNLMAYNRCVGTRYCSNNCPYKVRRFNYFDYNRRPLDRLYESPLNPLNESSNGEWELKRWFKDPARGSIPGLDDTGDPDWDLIKLSKNPDVSVRMRGVMEKCSYCTQRIQRAKIKQKAAARDTNKVHVKDGDIKTACEQACPANAIAFGDISDEASRVHKLKRQNRNYAVLGFLDTRPRTTYLAKVRNPNPDMPDYNSIPISTQEYNKKNHAHVLEASENGGNPKGGGN